MSSWPALCSALSSLYRLSGGQSQSYTGVSLNEAWVRRHLSPFSLVQVNPVCDCGEGDYAAVQQLLLSCGREPLPPINEILCRRNVHLELRSFLLLARYD